MKRILILGGGVVGSIAANKLARELRREIARGEIEITLLDKSVTSVNKAGFTFIPFGLYNKGDVVKERRLVISPRVNLICGEKGQVEKVNLADRNISTFDGKNYSYDYLLISTGCDMLPVKGLSKDFYAFYVSLDETLKLKEALNRFKKGRLVVLTVKTPIPCPGAPGMFTIMLDDYLKDYRGEEERRKIEITFLWPTDTIGPPAYNALVEKFFEEKNIRLLKNFKFREVDENRKEVVSEDGEKVKYDLLVTTPPHRAVKALVDSGITNEEGWVPADKYTLQYQGSEGTYDEVYVAGDLLAGLPKTGIAAHYQALITAQNLINDVLGIGEKALYKGETGCAFIGSMYTPRRRGTAYVPLWTYDRLPEQFPLTQLGWLAFRMYYYIHWDVALKGLM